MTIYTFRGMDDRITTVNASSEEEARRIAMIQRHGEIPDKVTPHAPKYKGLGLNLIEVKD
jgi:hypothetical protein